MNRTTPEQRVLIVQLRHEGHMIHVIADHVGCSVSTVKRVIASGATQMTPTDEVAELMSQGMTFRQIAAELNMTLDAVKSAYKRIKRALGPQAR